MSRHPHVTNIIVHVGTNDTSEQQSEVLKCDFNSLFTVLKDYNEFCFSLWQRVEVATEPKCYPDSVISTPEVAAWF